VVDVHDPGERRASTRREGGEDVQQRDRIGAARDSHEDAVAVRDQLMPPDGGPDARREASHVARNNVALTARRTQVRRRQKDDKRDGTVALLFQSNLTRADGSRSGWSGPTMGIWHASCS